MLEPAVVMLTPAFSGSGVVWTQPLRCTSDTVYCPGNRPVKT